MEEDRTPTVRRATVAEAAAIMGISAAAVRGRIRRGTLPVEREGGTVYVLVETPDHTRTTADQSSSTAEQPTDLTDFLIAELQDRVRFLEGANRENQRIITALTSRIPATGAPQEPPAVPETASEPAHRAGPVSHEEQAQEASESPETANSFYTAIWRTTPDLLATLFMAFRGTPSLLATLFMGFLGSVVAAINLALAYAIGLALALFMAILGSVVAIRSAGGESIPATFSSIVSAFSSIGPSLTGDQAVTIVSAIIGLIGSIGSAYLTVKLTRGATNRE